MLCVIEGCDGVGKTVFANVMQQVLTDQGLNGMIMKRSQPLPGMDPLEEYAQAIAHVYGSNTCRHLICDRWHVGEDVYGPIWRGESRLNRAKRAFVNALLDSRGAVMIHVTAAHETVIERCRTRGEALLAETDIQRVLDGFVMQTGDHHHWHTVNTTEIPLDKMSVVASVFIERALARENIVKEIMQLGTDYVGPMRPRALLVGDKPANEDMPTYGAFTPWNGNSGEYLLDALFDADMLRDGEFPRVGWVNSHETDLLELYKRLGEPPVVALGAMAKERLKNQGVEIAGHAHHPQFERRFKNSNRRQYGAHISTIIRGN